MKEVTYCTRRAFVPAVVVGSFGAPMIWAALTLGGDWSNAWWLIPMTGVGFGLMAALFVAIALAVFGFPVVWLLRPYLRQRWMIVIAAAWGGLAGEIIARMLLGEPFDWNFDQLSFLFILYGSVTGIAWWVFYQRATKAEEEKNLKRQAYIR